MFFVPRPLPSSLACLLCLPAWLWSASTYISRRSPWPDRTCYGRYGLRAAGCGLWNMPARPSVGRKRKVDQTCGGERGLFVSEHISLSS
jgi:hypothetical protein